jgi:hypothetical protein
MTLFIDYISLLKLILSSREKQGDYDINIMREIDFGNNFGSMTLSQHIHYLFQAMVDIKDIYKDDHYIQSHKLTLEHISSNYKKERFKDVCTMFYIISPASYMTYVDMERFICSLPLPVIKQIMNCLFISYEDLYNTSLPKQAPRLSIDTEDKIEDFDAEICYISRHYGTVDTMMNPYSNKMMSRLRSCFGFPKYQEKQEERESIFQ